MKTFSGLRLLSLCVAISAAGLLTAFRSAPSADEQAVLAPVQTLFDGMARKDSAMITGQVLSGGTLVAMHDGKPTQMTLEAFAERMGKPSPTTVQESIHDPLVKIDNDLAVVWAPFEVRRDGKLDSCGTDLFNLVRVDGKWLITSVAYTGRKDCPIK